MTRHAVVVAPGRVEQSAYRGIQARGQWRLSQPGMLAAFDAAWFGGACRATVYLKSSATQFADGCTCGGRSCLTMHFSVCGGRPDGRDRSIDIILEMKKLSNLPRELTLECNHSVAFFGSARQSGTVPTESMAPQNGRAAIAFDSCGGSVILCYAAGCGGFRR